MAARDNIKVAVRFRPFNETERSKGCVSAIESLEENSVRVRVGVDKNMHSFSFDRCFGIDAEQQSVYEYLARPLVDGLFQGYNAALLAYGQTGSGKTYSMMGPGMDVDDENRGIIPRAVHAIFENILSAPSNFVYTITVSFVEIYNEKIRELLYDRAKESAPADLEVKRNRNKDIYLEGARAAPVTSVEGVLAVMKQGNENRTTATTKMNDVSSRSHSVFLLNLNQTDSDTGASTNAKFYLVDLAGNESLGKTGVTGQQATELKSINQSLLTLGNVITALTEKGRTHIPYRESKLTFLLQDCLGGNAKTALLVTCSPSSYNDSETLSSLRFGKGAKMIQNKAVVNRALGLEDMKKYAGALERLLVAFIGSSREMGALYDAATAATGPPPEGLMAADRSQKLVREAVKLLDSAGVAVTGGEAATPSDAVGGSGGGEPPVAPVAGLMEDEVEAALGGGEGQEAHATAAEGVPHQLSEAYEAVLAERNDLAAQHEVLVGVLQQAQEELLRLRGLTAQQHLGGDEDGDEAMAGAAATARSGASAESSESLLTTIRAQEEEIEMLKGLLGAAREALTASRRGSFVSGHADAAAVAALTASYEAAQAENAALKQSLGEAQGRITSMEAALAAATAASGASPRGMLSPGGTAASSTEALDRLASAQRRVLELTAQTQDRDALLRELTQDLAAKNNTISEYEYRLRAVMDQMAEAAMTGDLRHIGQSSSVIHVVSEPDRARVDGATSITGGGGRALPAPFAVPSASSPAIHRTIRGGGGQRASLGGGALSPGGSLAPEDDNISFVARLVRRFSSSPNKAAAMAAATGAASASAPAQARAPVTSATATSGSGGRVTGSDFLKAAEEGNVPIVHEYLRVGTRGANMEDRDKRTAVMYAARGAAIPVLEVLHAAGADLSAFDKEGRYAMHYAARRGYSEVVAWLAAHGASVQVKDNYALQPLHHAVLAWSPATVQVLLQLGADPSARDGNGKTPAEVARRFATERPDASRDSYEAIQQLLMAAEAAQAGAAL